MKKHCFVIVLTVFSFIRPLLASDIACEIKQVTCGQLASTYSEAGVCQVIEIAKFGDSKEPVYGEVTFFVGARLGG